MSSPKLSQRSAASMNAYPSKSWNKQQSFCSARTFSRTTIFPPATPWTFTLPTWLLSSCLFQIPASSRCHLLLATARITPGHCFMALRLRARNRSFWKARSDQQTGPNTKTYDDATFLRLAHFTWDGRWPTMTWPSQDGLNKNCYALPTRKERASRISSSVPCTMAPMSTNPFKQEATKRPCSG